MVWPQPNGNDILVDGHNRWKIAAEHGGMNFKVVPIEFESREAAEAWIIRNQFGRRNLSAYDRSVLALKLKPMIQAEAKKRMVDAPQKKVKREKELQKIWDEYPFDIARKLAADKRQEFAKEDRRDRMRGEKYIYFARFNENCLKVGSSTCPEDRVKQLSVSCPDIQLIEKVFFGEGAERHENLLKKKFSEYQTGNECYQCSDEIIERMIAFTKRESTRKDGTDHQLAKVAGVSHDTIHKVEVIETHAPEEVKEKLRSGKISINEGYKQTTDIMRPLKRQDIAKQAAEEHQEFEQKKDSSVISMKDVAADRDNRRILALELSKRMAKAFNAIHDITALQGDLRKIISELTPEEKNDVKKSLEGSMKMLTQFYEQIGG